MAKTLKDKRATYIQVFKSEAAKEVLADLRVTRVRDDVSDTI